jgi:hypothetical protein
MLLIAFVVVLACACAQTVEDRALDAIVGVRFFTTIILMNPKIHCQKKP